MTRCCAYFSAVFFLLAGVSHRAAAEGLVPSNAQTDFEVPGPARGVRVSVHPLSLLLNTINVSAELPVSQSWTVTVDGFLMLGAINSKIWREVWGDTNGGGAEVAARFYWGRKAQRGFYVSPGIRYLYFANRPYDNLSFGDAPRARTRRGGLHVPDVVAKVGYQIRPGQRFAIDLAVGTTAVVVRSLASGDFSPGVALATVLVSGNASLGVVF